jgi:hypothetical protein
MVLGEAASFALSSSLSQDCMAGAVHAVVRALCHFGNGRGGEEMRHADYGAAVVTALIAVLQARWGKG